MHERLVHLHAACLPFVTRALRGPRRRRSALGAGLLTLLVGLTSLWIGLSSSPSAHHLRVSLGMEQHRWEREQAEFCIFVDSELERDRMLRPAAAGDAAPMHPARRSRAEAAWTRLDIAASPQLLAPRPLQPLQARARQLRDARLELAPENLDARRRSVQFNWYRPGDVQALRAIIDAELSPRVLRYRSPLSVADAFRLMGMMAAGLLLLLLTVGAPLWVGVRLAQELHDNTLQPLTGTALTARQLVIGLVVGPLAPIAIVAAPLCGLVLATGAAVGRLLPTLGFLAAAFAMAAMLVGLAMLGALAVGRRRAPGLVGIGLLALLSLTALAGLGAGLDLGPSMLGVVTIVPGAGPVHLLTEAFNPVAQLTAAQAQTLDLRLLLATAGALVLAATAMRAIERWVGGTHRDGALRPREALVAAVTLSVLAMSAMPSRHTDFGTALFIGMAVVLVPLQLVLVGRVPGGDVPPPLRTVPTGRLLREYFGWLGLTPIVAVMVGGWPESMVGGALLGLVHLAWALVVVALVTIRAATLPSTLAIKLWLIICVGFALVEYATAAMWCMEPVHGGDMMFPLSQVSPLLGVIHVGMFLWIPVSLLRGLTPAPPTPAPGPPPRPEPPAGA